MTEKKRSLQLMPIKKNWLVILMLTFLCTGTIFAQTGTLITSVEVESGALYGGLTLSTDISGFSGTGYVTNFKNAGDSVRVIVKVPATAFHSIYVRYNCSGNKYQYIDVNGTGASSVYFPQTNGWAIADAGKYFLHQGDNKVTIKNSWGWLDFDQIQVYTTVMNTYDKIVTNPVDPNASISTRSLYNFLLSQFGKKIISGQTDGNYYDSIKSISGKSPLYRTYDFQHYTQGYSYLWNNGGFSFGIDPGANSSEKAIAWYNSTGKRGIVGFQWHWHSPAGGNVGKNSFYTAETTFDIRKAVQKGTPEYDLIIRDIDAIGVQLKKFQTANIPVIFRPLHEAGGGWFWWGAHGGASCKQLYAIMFDRLTNYHQLHNLIWAWSTPETDWYPGNNTVDIVGHDSYPGDYNYGTQKNTFDQYYKLVNGEKLIAMTENGPIPDPDNCLDFDSPWSLFMSWNDLVKSQNERSHIKAVFNNPRVLTLENDTIPMIISTTNASICGTQAVTLTATANFGTVNWYDAAIGGKLIKTGTSFTTPVLTQPAIYYVEASYNGHVSELKRIPVRAIVSSPILKSSISGSSNVCQGSGGIEYSLPFDPNVISYSWTLTEGATVASAGTANIIWVNIDSNAKSGNITAKGQNACGDGPENTFAITVNSLPATAGKISGASTLCRNSGNNEYVVPEIGGATSYSWTLPTGATGSSTSNRILINFNDCTGNSVDIKVAGHNDCGDGTASIFTINLKQLPGAAGKIAGAASLCRSTDKVTYSVPIITGATSYIWTLSSGVTGTSTSRIISIDFDPTIISANIKVKGHNDCGDGTESSLNITINEIPASPQVTFTNGVLRSDATSGNQWYLDNLSIPNAINNVFTPSRSGDYFSVVTLNGCSSDLSNTVSVFRTGIDEVNNKIGIFPNPIEKGNSKLNISGINSTENILVKIFDDNGRLIYNDTVTGQKIDLGKGFETGIYIINVVNDRFNFMEKLIVK
jgi:mannan endo-1,4-beta-mannosidase